MTVLNLLSSGDTNISLVAKMFGWIVGTLNSFYVTWMGTRNLLLKSSLLSETIILRSEETFG